MKKLLVLLCILCMPVWAYGAADSTSAYPAALDTITDDCSAGASYGTCFDVDTGDIVYPAHHDALADAIIKLETKLGYIASTPVSGYLIIGSTTAGTSTWYPISGGITLSNTGVVTFADDYIGESMLDIETDGGVNDVPADEECLTYESATGKFEWQDCAVAAGAGLVDSVWDCGSGDCTQMTVAEGNYLNMSDAFGATIGTTEGLILPQLNGLVADCSGATGDGQVCYNDTTDILYIGDGTQAEGITATGLVCSSCVETGDITNGTITYLDVATDTLVAGNIATDAIGAAELADSSVDSAAIVNATITYADIALDTIRPENLQDGTSGITAGDIVSITDGSNFNIRAQASGTDIFTQDLEEEDHGADHRAFTGSDSIYQTDPNGTGDSFWFYDDTTNSMRWVQLGTGLTYDTATHTMTAAGGGGGGDNIAEGDSIVEVVDAGTGYIQAYVDNDTDVADTGNLRLPQDFTISWENGALYTIDPYIREVGGNLRAYIAGDYYFNIYTGNLCVGTSCTGDVTMDGNDAFISGTLEVDGAARFDGAVTYGSSATPTMTFDDSGSTAITDDGKIVVNADTETAAAEDTSMAFYNYMNGLPQRFMYAYTGGSASQVQIGTATEYLTIQKDANGTSLLLTDTNATDTLTIGDGGTAENDDLVYINTSDWDITTAGNMSGIGTIATDGVITSSVTSTNATLADNDDLILKCDANSDGTNYFYFQPGGSTTAVASINESGNIDVSGTIQAGSGNHDLTNATGLIDGEKIQDDTIDDDSIDFTDITGADLTLTDCTNVTASGTVQAEQLTSTDDATITGDLTAGTMTVTASNDPYLKLDEDTAGQADWVIGTDSATDDSLEFRTSDTVGDAVVMEIFEDGEVSFGDANDPYLMLDEETGGSTDWYLGVDDTGNSIELRTSATVGTGVGLEVTDAGALSAKRGVTLDTDATVTMTDADCRGQMKVNNDDDVIEYDLPTAAVGLNCCFYNLYAKGLTIDANTGDEIYLDGVSIGAADGIVADAVGETICVLALDDTRWVTLNKVGTWTDTAP